MQCSVPVQMFLVITSRAVRLQQAEQSCWTDAIMYWETIPDIAGGPQVQQAVRGYSPEVAVQSVGAGSGADGMVSTAPDGGSGMGATTQAVPPPDPAAAAEATIEPMADAASVVSAVQDQSTMVEPAAAVPEAVDSPAAAVAAAPALAPAAEVSHAAPVPAIGPSAVTLPPVCLSTDETMAPTSPVLVSPFAAIAAVPARFSLDESNSLRTLDTPQVCCGGLGYANGTLHDAR